MALVDTRRGISGPQVRRQAIDDSLLENVDRAFIRAELVPDGNHVRVEADRGRNAEDVVVLCNPH